MTRIELKRLVHSEPVDGIEVVASLARPGDDPIRIAGVVKC